MSALLLVSVIWGAGFLFQKWGAEELSTAYLVAWRFTVAFVPLAIITRKNWKLIDKGYLLGGLASGSTLAIGLGLQTLAMAYGTEPGKCAFLTATYCVMVPFFCWLFWKKVPKRAHALAAIFCLLGIGLISLNTDFTITIGDGLTLLGGVVFALNILSIAKFCVGRDPMLITMLQILVGAICGWIALLYTGSFPESVSLNGAWNIAYLGLFSTCLCMSLQSYGLKYINETVGTIILSLESVFGTIFSVIFYKEIVTTRMGIGFVIIFVAVLLSQLAELGKSSTKTE